MSKHTLSMAQSATNEPLFQLPDKTVQGLPHLHCRHCIIAPNHFTCFGHSSHRQNFSRHTGIDPEQFVAGDNITCLKSTKFNHVLLKFAHDFAPSPFCLGSIFCSPQLVCPVLRLALNKSSKQSFVSMLAYLNISAKSPSLSAHRPFFILVKT